MPQRFLAGVTVCRVGGERRDFMTHFISKAKLKAEMEMKQSGAIENMRNAMSGINAAADAKHSSLGRNVGAG